MTERIAGRINVYHCRSGHGTVTRDADAGTTPFMIACPDCGADAMSALYRVDQSLVPPHEWYKPTIQKAKRIDRTIPGTLEHVERGGLLLREAKRTPGDAVKLARGSSLPPRTRIRFGR